jgi:hypothetical protein
LHENKKQQTNKLCNNIIRNDSLEIEKCVNEIVDKICIFSNKQLSRKPKIVFINKPSTTLNIIIECICKTYEENCLLVMCQLCEVSTYLNLLKIWKFFYFDFLLNLSFV